MLLLVLLLWLPPLLELQLMMPRTAFENAPIIAKMSKRVRKRANMKIFNIGTTPTPERRAEMIRDELLEKKGRTYALGV